MMCGSTIAWGNKLQSPVAISTVEAEYMALSTSTHEVIFLIHLLTNLGEKVKGLTPMFEDNEGCETLATTDNKYQDQAHRHSTSLRPRSSQIQGSRDRVDPHLRDDCRHPHQEHPPSFKTQKAYK